MKGVSPIISAFLIIMIYITLTLAAFQWGVPIIEKNRDFAIIDRAENFLFLLDKKIERVVKLGSTEEIIFMLPGKLYINPTNDTINLQIMTRGAIYYPENYTCIVENCDTYLNITQVDVFFAPKVRSHRFMDRAIIKYLLEPREFKKGNDIYTVDILGSGNSLVATSNSKLIIRSPGLNSSVVGGGKLIKVKINISIES